MLGSGSVGRRVVAVDRGGGVAPVPGDAAGRTRATSAQGGDSVPGVLGGQSSGGNLSARLDRAL